MAVNKGNLAIRWIETYCRIPEGYLVGQPLKLCPFQKKLIRGIYNSSSRTVIISFAKKNAKTTLAACLNLLHLCGPFAIRNSQLYSTAQSRDQAAILYELMAKMIRFNVDLDSCIRLQDSGKRASCPDIGTSYQALSADAVTAHGKSPAFVVHDELGQVRGPRSDLYDAIETAMVAHKNPLSVIISTQAPTDQDLLSTLIDDGLTGRNPRTKVFLYAASDDINPFTKKALRQANPGFDLFMNQEELFEKAQNAKNLPSLEGNYRNLNLNQRVDAEAPMISPGIWKKNRALPRDEDFENGVFLALDLSEYVDLSSLTACGVGEDGHRSLKCDFFTPKSGLKERSMRDRVPYDIWHKKGLIIATPGASIDYSFIAKRIEWWHQNYDVKELRVDPWNYARLEKELNRLEITTSDNEDDYPDLILIKQYQGANGMCSHINFFESELVNGRIRHGDHEVLKWMASNVVATADAEGKRKLDKKKSVGRIDGIVTACMAVGGSALYTPESCAVGVYYA